MFEGCNKTFIFYGSLKFHSYSHNGFKGTVCSVEGCNKSFIQSSTLKSHMLTHTGIRPFKCTYTECNKTFYEKGNLEMHKRSHLGIKHYKCYFEGCEQKFSLSSSLKKHLNTHDDSKKDFFCSYCTNTFKRYISLQLHLKVHKSASNMLSTKRQFFTCSKQVKDIGIADSQCCDLKLTQFDSDMHDSDSYKLPKIEIQNEDSLELDTINGYFNPDLNLEAILSFLDNNRGLFGVCSE